MRLKANLRRTLGKLGTALRLPLADKALLLEALTLMALARAAVLVLPFRWVARLLGRRAARTPVQEDAGTVDIVRRVGAMVQWSARNVPWTSKCLDQALAAKVMLVRRGITATVYFGVRNDKEGRLAAHAWLRSGNVCVTGGKTCNRFTVINTFA